MQSAGEGAVDSLPSETCTTRAGVLKCRYDVSHVPLLVASTATRTNLYYAVDSHNNLVETTRAAAGGALTMDRCTGALAGSTAGGLSLP